MSQSLQQKSVNKTLSNEEFEKLIQNSESSTIDFKRTMYDFSDDAEFKSTAKFVKDVISFINTIRTETSYIIIGIHENEDGTKELLGLDKNIDDSILQAKVKDKVYPVPKFSYYRIEHNSKTYGILEFPMHKYDVPLTPTVKMKGLQVGMPYYRMGTSNVEAIGSMVIQINEWFKSLPELVNNNNEEPVSQKITSLLKKATNDNQRLSELLIEILSLAKSYKFDELLNFCNYELKGLSKSDVNANQDVFKYRIQNVAFSIGEFQINTMYGGIITSNGIVNFLKENKNYYDYRLLFSQSITEIEASINRTSSDRFYSTLSMTVKEVLPSWDGRDMGVTVYVFHETYLQLYKKIRQKIIELLMAI